MRAALLATVFVLLPGVAVAAIDNSSVACSSGPTYFPRGDRWVMPPSGTSPNIAPQKIVYRLQRDGSDDITGSSADLEAIARAAATWTDYRCGTQSPSVALARGADYDNRDRGDVYDSSDNLVSVQHTVYFFESNTGWEADKLTIALTTNLREMDTGRIVTADMEFNGFTFKYRARGNDSVVRGCSTSGPDASTCFDIEAVALHEFGHFLGFNHVDCGEAVMYPKGNASGGPTELSVHEATGLCAVYPPRDGTKTKSQWGELCSQTSDCETGLDCVKAPGATQGWCSKLCSDTSQCPTAYVCRSMVNATTRYCGPGLNGTGAGVAVDPDTGEPADFCKPCSTGADCSNGLCVKAHADEPGLCTQACNTDEHCPEGMSCTALSGGAGSVCWDTGGSGVCQSDDDRAVLNEVCFIQGGGAGGDDYYKPCGPGLICFGFKPRCEGQQGACVPYCNASQPCPDANQTCCYGVDSNGNCITSPTSEVPNGGCFDLRGEGESCVTAESSICQAGLGCFNTGDATQSKCFRYCTSQAGCASGQECLTFDLQCPGSTQGGTVSLCCKAGTACEPTLDVSVYDVGVACHTDADCDSGLCWKHNGQAACSRACNPVTGYGCPGNIDVNYDGTLDGGFTCLIDGHCWPKQGPATPPAMLQRPPPPPPDGGCCSAVGAPMRGGDVLMTLLVWLPLLGYWRRRRRSVTHL